MGIAGASTGLLGKVVWALTLLITVIKINTVYTNEGVAKLFFMFILKILFNNPFFCCRYTVLCKAYKVNPRRQYFTWSDFYNTS